VIAKIPYDVARSGAIIVPSLLEWNKLQVEEILSEKNRYYTEVSLGRPVKNNKELAIHYGENGGSEDFAKTHIKGWFTPSRSQKN
jgi:hypothetical protein